jgi:hypothetical protein
MVESFLTQNLLTRGETAIGDYLRTSQSDYSNIWKETFADLLLDLDTMGLKIRQLCERLSLQTSVTKTAAFNGTISSQDYAQRMRLVIPVSAVTGDAVFTLQGSDDSGTNYYDIQLVSDDGTAGTTVTISTAATGNSANSYVITRLYEKYRLKLISIGTTVTYTGYLIEEVYTTLHRDITRRKIYETLMAQDRDLYMIKFEEYAEKYNNRLAEARLRVDYTDDDFISKEEGEKRIANIRFTL